MLILSRKIGEVIRINDDITVEVHQIDRNKVRLAITAPPGVTIHRQEVWERIQRGEAQKPSEPKS